MAEDKLEVLVFYSPHCSRCKSVKRLIREAEEAIGSFVRFRLINCDLPHVKRFILPRYKVTRIPSIVARGEVYFVGVPDKRDLISMLSYLYTHPEGGHGIGG